MAFRIGEFVTSGEINNLDRGRVVGRIWFEGKTDPIQLELKGNCLRDIAGHRITFECTKTRMPPNDIRLPSEQKGVVGDITASRKVKTWPIPFEEAMKLKEAGKDVPVVMANCLYIEWFSNANGRVVIETVDFRVTELSDPEWRMTVKEDEAQRTRNAEAIGQFIELVAEELDEARSQWRPEDDKAMDEFEWERFMKKSDKRSDRHLAALEKYRGHPDAERLIAREMGWDRLDDLLDADDRGVFDEVRAAEKEEPLPDLVPEPHTEGVDWMRTEDGDIRHPLAHRAAEASIRMWHTCDELGLLGEGGNEAVHDMTFQAHMISAKLAGALNSLGYDDDRDRGFLVAYLKRALTYFSPTMEALQKVAKLDLIDPNVLKEFQNELFQIREEMLRLMKRYREEMGSI